SPLRALRVAEPERADEGDHVPHAQRCAQTFPDRLRLGGGRGDEDHRRGQSLIFSKWTRSAKARKRSRIWVSSSLRKRSRLKSSTENEASTEPRIIAVRIVAGVTFPSRTIQPMKPPAKESPAPVGSTTFSIGNARAANNAPHRA